MKILNKAFGCRKNVRTFVYSALSVSVLALMGCQSTQSISQPNHFIDVSSSQAKSEFLMAKEQYINQDSYISTQSYAQIQPLFKDGDIDNHTSPLAKSVLQTFMYQMMQAIKSDPTDVNIYEDLQYSHNEGVADDTTKDLSDADFSEEYLIYDEVVNLSKSQNLYDTQVDAAQFDVMNDSDKMYNKFSPTYWLDNYIQMQQDAELNTSFEQSLQPFNQFFQPQITQENAAWQNLYFKQPLQITQKIHYQPSKKRMDGKINFQANQATYGYSVDMPVRLDFNDAYIVADISALLPVMSAILPEVTPLPKDFQNGLVKITLPQELKDSIPPALIFQALNQSYLQAFRSLDDQKFTSVDFSQDAYAKELKATKVIKLNLSSKDIGTMIGMMAKITESHLKSYIDNHPQFYQEHPDAKYDATKIKKAIELWSTINKGYQSEDVGGLLAALETLITLGLENGSYYYLNNQNQLLGIKSFTNVKMRLNNSKETMVTYTKISTKPFDESFEKLSEELSQPSVQINDDLKHYFEQKKLKQDAAQVREQYLGDIY